MIAAIYARKSTEQTGVSDEEKSVTRQIEHAKLYAAKKGWTVPDELVFVDDGISGAEFVKRPGYARLMNVLEPRPPFQILIMSEESRLGREQIKTAYALQQITDAGVQVWFYLTDQERKLDTAMDKLMCSIVGFASEDERERAQVRTSDAMSRKAKAGHVTGGKVFGYDNQERLSPEGHRQYVVRVVNETQADLVRRIFHMYLDGLGIGRIAKQLNAEGILPPRRRAGGWAPCAIREMLRRKLYSGVIVYGRLQKIDRGGTKIRRPRHENDWIQVDAPHLRIIDPNLWESVQVRLARTKGQNRPRVRDFESPYLLTGFCRCASCGGPIMMSGCTSSKWHRRQGKFYACSYHLKRGSSICRNATMAPQETLERAALDGLTDLLHPRTLTLALQMAMRQLQPDQAALRAQRAKIEAELAQTKTAIQRLNEAIVQGGGLESLIARLQHEEGRKRELTEELDHLTQAGPSEWDLASLRRNAESRLADTRALLGRQPSDARAIMKRLFDAPLLFGSVEEEGKVKFVVEGSGNFSSLLTFSDSPLPPPSKVVSPTGFEPVLLP